MIIHLPESVTLVSLSATVSNAEEFGDWLDTVRGDTEVIVSEHRPVPLWQHVMAGRRMYDLFEETTDHGGRGAGRREVNPDLVRLARQENQNTYNPRDRRRGKMVREADRERERRQRGRIWTPGRPEVIDRLDNEGLLPAITFIFSRAGCEAAVQQCLYAGLRLNDEDNRRLVREIVEERTASIPGEDLHVLGYYEWLEGLERASPPTTRACSRPSRRSSRNCSSGGWSRRSSPPRRWRSASTCPRAPWCWRSSSSGTASSTPTSPPASTRSSPAGPDGAASTSRATRWSCGSAAWTRRRWPASRARARIRCAPASARRTTWRSTWCSSSGGTVRASCWRPRSPSSRRTSRSWGSRGRCSVTRRAWRATRRA